MDHIHFMRRCLALAEQGRGKVGMNPLVGSVLVRDGKIIAEGYYDHYGAEHAEAALLRSFQEDILPTDILYVNLEPCCHHGMRPPCTDALRERGVKTVVYGMQDPDERVAGKGIETLRESGITVIGPVLPVECQRFNRGYVSIRSKHRPWITLKRAQTREGEIAYPDGSKRKITSPNQDAWSHELLRARHDAILVGVGTVINDDPELTVRLNKKVDQSFQPWKVILDPSGRMPSSAKVHGNHAIVVTAEQVVLEDNIFEWNALWEFLTSPREGFPGISSLLVEGGARTWDTFLSHGFYDEQITLIGD